MPCSTNMESVRVVFGGMILVSYILGAFSIKKIIPLPLAVYEIIIPNLVLRASVAIYHLIQLFRKRLSYKGEKLTRQSQKLLWVMSVFTVALVNVKVF